MFNTRAHDKPARKSGGREGIDIVAEMRSARELAKKYKRDYAAMQVTGPCLPVHAVFLRLLDMIAWCQWPPEKLMQSVMAEKGERLGAEEGASTQDCSRERGMKSLSSVFKHRRAPFLKAQHLQI
jgi:hypothetical protein